MKSVMKFGPFVVSALAFAVCIGAFAIVPKNHPVAVAWAWRSLAMLGVLFLTHWWAAR